mgnify:FL=1
MPDQKKNINEEISRGSIVQAGSESFTRGLAFLGDALATSSSNDSSEGKRLVASSLKDFDLKKGKSDYHSLRVVVLSLNGHEQAIEVDLVEEIIMAPQVSRLIKGPFFLDGVIRLRGKIVPVVDLKKAMRLSQTSDSNKSDVVMMVRLWGKRIGFKVDAVLELLTIPINSIEKPRGVIGGVDSRFMKGMTYIEDRFLVILDLEAMLSEDRQMILQDPESFEVSEEFVEPQQVDETLSTRRIISFILDKEIFGVEMGEVAEIMEMTPIMPIPNVPEFVLGLINLRGTIVPVVDLRTLFQMSCGPLTSHSRIVIMKHDNLLIGVIVDSMWESLRLSQDLFQPPPHSLAKIDAQYFKDISLVHGRVVSVLDISKIISDTSIRSRCKDKVTDLLAPGAQLNCELHA